MRSIDRRNVGAGKPDPRGFHALLEKLGVAAGESVMVGDSLPRDIQPAREMGMRTIWVNRAGKDADGEIQPDATIRELSPLPGLLA